VDNVLSAITFVAVATTVPHHAAVLNKVVILPVGVPTL